MRLNGNEMRVNETEWEMVETKWEWIGANGKKCDPNLSMKSFIETQHGKKQTDVLRTSREKPHAVLPNATSIVWGSLHFTVNVKGGIWYPKRKIGYVVGSASR